MSEYEIYYNFGTAVKKKNFHKVFCFFFFINFSIKQLPVDPKVDQWPLMLMCFQNECINYMPKHQQLQKMSQKNNRKSFNLFSIPDQRRLWLPYYTHNMDGVASENIYCVNSYISAVENRNHGYFVVFLYLSIF